jgi:phosphate transport system permease protein
MIEASAGGGQPPSASAPAAGVPAIRRRSRVLDQVAHRAVAAAAAVNVLVVLLVVVFLALRAAPGLKSVGLGQFFGSTNWQPDANIGGFGGGTSTFGALSPILGSFAVVSLALLIAVPFAVSVAVVLTETNPRIGERFIRPAVEVFVGIPSVVYGYVGFIALLPLLRHLAPPGRDGSGVLAAAIVLAIMVIPTVASISADGLLAIPAALREGSLALGATRWQTIWRVLLPAARPSLVTGVVLGFARAMGEALAVALVIGDVNVIPSVAKQGVQALLEPFTTMTVSITDGVANLAINPDGTAARYMLALVLLIVTLISILIVRMVVRRSESRS